MKQTFKKVVSGLLSLVLVMNIAQFGVVFAEDGESTYKTSSTYYTPEMIAAARENAENYTWASSTVTEAVAKADNLLSNVDAIYNMVPNHTIPRSIYLGENDDDLNGHCMYCGVDLKTKYGNNSWNIDMINRPWEIQCKECEKYFPSNDFSSFYNNGLNEHGEFDRTLALENNGILCGRGERDESGNYVVYDEYEDNPYGYGDPGGNLYNEKFTDLYAANAVDPYFKNAKNTNVPITQGWGSFNVGGTSGVPSAGYFWGVDDGLGYNTGRNSGGVNEIHRYAAVANYNGFWYNHANTEQPIVYAALTAFRDAYVYTGDKRYAIAGAKILDRVADLYPDFDFGVDCVNLTTSGLGSGKISGYIHENFVNRVFTTAYDAFFDCYDEPALIEYLSAKATEWNLDNPKTSGAHLRNHVEENILLETYNAVRSGDIKGNFGMSQQTLITAAVILDNDDTAEIIDYVMRPGPDGGGLYDGILTHLSRDGYGNESSLSYNNIFASTYFNIVEVLSRYPKVEPRYDIANNPRAINGLIQGPDLILAGVRTPNIGDASGGFQTTGIADRSALWLYGLKNTDNPVFAQMLYFNNGNTANGIKYDIFTENPESAKDKVEEVIEEHGELDLSKSSILTGYGFAALRDGTLSTQRNTMQDWWMYWGPYDTTHGHADALNLGLDAFGLNMAPDLGYGASGGYKAEWNSQWIEGTPSHNTVVVNNQQQTRLRQSHFPLHFDDSGDVKVMDVDVPDAYRNVVDTFRRTVVSVAIDETVSYALDFFRIIGGNEHVYSFHAASHESTLDFNEGVELVAQSGGTYAGENIAHGAQHAEKSSGFSWLTNVERATNPGKKFSVDFEITDYRNFIKGNGDLHLKLTQLNGFELNEVARADGETIPGSNNPEYIDYILARRSGTDLDTLFTTVLEPYEDNSKINALTRVNVVRKDGTPLGADEPVAAVKVELDGRTDYVVYSADNEVTYTVDGLFDFCGFVGVYTVNTATNEVARTYINDGTQIGDATQERAAVTGEVVDFTREIAFKNFIEVDVDNAVVDAGLLENLVGRMIVIENDGVDNAAYVIETAEKKGDNLLIGTGSVDLARRRVLNEDLSIVPNFAVGNSYRIALSTTEGSIDEIPVRQPATYNLGRDSINQADTTAWDPDNNGGSSSAASVIGYGSGETAHNWYFYGFGSAAEEAIASGGARNQLANFNATRIRIKAVNGTEGDSGYFDTTADGGTTVALSLKAPEAGYYRPVVKDHNGATWDVTLANPTIAFGPKKSNLSVDDYMSDVYKLPASGAIYSDGETPIILAINNNETSYKQFGSVVLTPLTTGEVALSTEEIIINEVGGTGEISVTVGGAPLVDGFAQFVSANVNVATVSPEGVVTGISDGTTTINVSVGDDFVAEVEVAVVLNPITYTFNNTVINQSDPTAWDTSKANASVVRVVGYGTGENAHNWYFYGFGSAAQEAIASGGAVNQLGNLNATRIRVRAVNGTEGASGYFDTTANGGTTVALSLKAPVRGYYKAAVNNHNGVAHDVTAVNPQIAFGPEIGSLSIDDYMSDVYKLPTNGVVYSDGETPIILALNANASGDSAQFASAVLTPQPGEVALSTEEIIINEAGGTGNISITVNGAPLVDGFAEFVSADEDIATVSPAGVVTGISDGTTTINVTVGDFVAEVEVAVVLNPITYTFNNTVINQADPTAWDTSKANASVVRVVGYGTGENAHNWYFYGFGSAAQEAWWSGGAVNQLGNLNATRIRIKAVNGTEGDSGYFDTTADGGTTVALSLKAPRAGYYKAVVKDHNGATWDATLANPTIAFGPEKSGLSVDDYMSDTYKLPENGAIYSDGETPVILAINNNESSYKQFGSAVLTPQPGEVVLSTEEIIINEAGGTENISVTVGGAPLVDGFAEFVSANENVATVSPAGVVTGVSDGTTTINVTVGDFEKTVAVTVGTGSTPVVPQDVTYTFNRTVIDQSDPTAWDPDNNGGTASGASVIGYGTHNWYFYGFGSAAENAWKNEGASRNQLANFNSTVIKLQAKKDGSHDLTADGGTTAALSLKAPAAGYYMPTVIRGDTGNAWQTYLDDPIIAIGPEKSGVSDADKPGVVDGYISSGAYRIPRNGGAIYSDGSTPIILALNTAGSSRQFSSAVLTPITGDVVLSTEEITINEGSTGNISITVGGTPLVPGFATFTSANENVATVSPAGVVTGVSEGTTVIEVTVGSFVAEVEVTVAS